MLSYVHRPPGILQPMGFWTPFNDKNTQFPCQTQRNRARHRRRARCCSWWMSMWSIVCALDYWDSSRHFCHFFFVSLLLSSSTRRRFYPQRSCGQAVVTGVVPSPPRYVPSFLFERSEFLIDTSQKKSLRVCTCARVPVCPCARVK